MSNNQDRKDVERKVSEILEEGKLDSPEVDEIALLRLAPKYEIRQVVQLDPIVEETKLIREMAEEVDDRYDAYMKQAEATRNARNKDEDKTES